MVMGGKMLLLQPVEMDDRTTSGGRSLHYRPRIDCPDIEDRLYTRCMAIYICNRKLRKKKKRRKRGKVK